MRACSGAFARLYGRAVIALCAALAAATLATAAQAEPGLLVGVSDDAFATHPADAFAAGRELGLGGVRVLLRWNGEEQGLAADEASRLDGVVARARAMRVVVAIMGQSPGLAPQTDEQRAAYCSYAADVLRRYPAIRDVVVWNEPNVSRFWRPQFDGAGRSIAPAAYEALLARCWDALHGVRGDANVITSTSTRGNDQPDAASNVSHAPASFLLGVGAAYRASGRQRPLFDTVGQHVYPARSSEPPSTRHRGSTIAQGDLPRLLRALATAFGGTPQAVPGRCADAGCPSIWYLEGGYQTVPTAETAAQYTGAETDPAPIGDDAQAEQVRAAIRLAYCQPGVGAYFNFLLRDEPDLGRWQSGLLSAGGTPKPAYDAFRDAIAEANAGTIDCSSVTGGTSPQPAAPPPPATPAPASAPAPPPPATPPTGPVIVVPVSPPKR